MKQHTPAAIVLANGMVFEGISVGIDGCRVGELVFNTSMTGYQEIFTDPSYANQIITLTAAHIGNVGCNLDDMESTRVWAKGLVVRHCTSTPSNYRATQSLPDWLIKHDVVAIANVDTRAITQVLRDQGSMGACITTDLAQLEHAKKLAADFEGLEGVDLAQIVSRQTIERWHTGRGDWAIPSLPSTKHVIVYDFGVKQTILRILHDVGCHVTVVPAKTQLETVMSMNPDGIVLSNGPGDPSVCDYAIETTKSLLEQHIPLLGICLGFQILALACGAKVLKMPFGHHGGNHPVMEINNKKRVYITSQNHGFAVDEASLPACLAVTHRSLFDGSLQGIIHTDVPAVGFQGHPEASPGPHDIEGIFGRFFKLMCISSA